MKGWYGDRTKHSLASRGVKTVNFDYGNMIKGKTAYNDEVVHMLGYLTSEQWADAIIQAREDNYFDEAELWKTINQLDERWSGIKNGVMDALEEHYEREEERERRRTK